MEILLSCWLVVVASETWEVPLPLGHAHSLHVWTIVWMVWNMLSGWGTTPSQFWHLQFSRWNFIINQLPVLTCQLWNTTALPSSARQPVHPAIAMARWNASPGRNSKRSRRRSRTTPRAQRVRVWRVGHQGSYEVVYTPIHCSHIYHKP